MAVARVPGNRKGPNFKDLFGYIWSLRAIPAWLLTVFIFWTAMPLSFYFFVWICQWDAGYYGCWAITGLIIWSLYALIRADSKKARRFRSLRKRNRVRKESKIHAPHYHRPSAKSQIRWWYGYLAFYGLAQALIACVGTMALKGMLDVDSKDWYKVMPAARQMLERHLLFKSGEY